MKHLLKRGEVYWYDCLKGGVRQRFSLGTRDPRVAKKLVQRIEFSIADGPRSEHWQELRPDLPEASFKQLTADRNVPIVPALDEFQKRFQDRLDRRVNLGELSVRSRDLYVRYADWFFVWLRKEGVQIMDDVVPSLVERYLAERRTDIVKSGGNGNGISTSYTALSNVFSFAIEEGVLRTSPLTVSYHPDLDPKPINPFSPEELERLEANLIEEDRLPYFLLRWTGLRGSDAVDVKWSSINWEDKTLTWKTKKRRKWVVVPLRTDLFELLRNKYITRNEDDPDLILSYISKRTLYYMILSLGKRANVTECHPHRFRCTLVSELLGKGASLFDVSKLIGDSHDVVEKFYAAETRGQQDRVRGILEGK